MSHQQTDWRWPAGGGRRETGPIISDSDSASPSSLRVEPNLVSILYICLSAPIRNTKNCHEKSTLHQLLRRRVIEQYRYIVAVLHSAFRNAGTWWNAGPVISRFYWRCRDKTIWSEHQDAYLGGKQSALKSQVSTKNQVTPAFEGNKPLWWHSHLANVQGAMFLPQQKRELTYPLFSMYYCWKNQDQERNDESHGAEE